MARQSLGAPPSRPTELVDINWVYATFPSYSSTLTLGTNYTVVLPPSPIDHTMFLLEVKATATIIVSVPNGTLLTSGTAPNLTIFSGKIGFLGFRYSATAGAWFLLSATAQV